MQILSLCDKIIDLLDAFKSNLFALAFGKIRVLVLTDSKESLVLHNSIEGLLALQGTIGALPKHLLRLRDLHSQVVKLVIWLHILILDLKYDFISCFSDLSLFVLV